MIDFVELKVPRGLLRGESILWVGNIVEGHHPAPAFTIPTLYEPVMELVPVLFAEGDHHILKRILYF